MTKKSLLFFFSLGCTLLQSPAFGQNNACEAIQRVAHAAAATCKVESSSPHAYRVVYKLSGTYEYSSPINAFSKSDWPNSSGDIQVMEWLAKRGSYSLSGQTECRLDTLVAKWSCITRLVPFKIIVEQTLCSCEMGGFAGCGISLQCLPTLTTSEDGMMLIDPKGISEAVEKAASVVSLK